MMSKVFRLTLVFVIGLAPKRLCVPEWLSAHLWAELCLAFGIGLIPYQQFYRYDWRRIRDAYRLLWRGRSVVGWTFTAAISCATWIPLFSRIDVDQIQALPTLPEMMIMIVLSLIMILSLIGGVSCFLMMVLFIIRPTAILEVPGSIEPPDPVVWYHYHYEPKPAPSFTEQAKDYRWLTFYGNPIGMICFLARTISKWLPMSRCRLTMIS